MSDKSNEQRVALNRAFYVALLSVAVTIISCFVGYYLAVVLSNYAEFSVNVHETDPYVGCQMFPEWISRAITLCRPVLLQSLLLWISPYTKFDTPLTAGIFMDRGVSLGLSLRFCAGSTFGLSITLLPVLHALVTAVFILFAYSLRDSRTVRPLGDTFVHFLISSGFSFIIYTVSPWIL